MTKIEHVECGGQSVITDTKNVRKICTKSNEQKPCLVTVVIGHIGDYMDQYWGPCEEIGGNTDQSRDPCMELISMTTMT